LQLPSPLPPGDHTATAIAVTPGSVRVRVSEEVQISIPRGAIPRYAENEVDPPGNVSGVDEAPPNAATRRLAAELAHEASREFSKLTAGSPEADKAPAAELSGAPADDDELPETFALRDMLQPSLWIKAIAAWLARSRRDYDEILVAGLSDPDRRLTYEGAPMATIPPLPDRAADATSRIESVFTSAIGWLRRASRDYHKYVVQELALRGIEDPEQRQAARAAAFAEQTASPSGESVPSEPSRPQSDRIAQARQKELAETKRREKERLAEARRLADERAAAEQRRVADELTRQRAAEEEKAQARQHAEAKRNEQEQQRERLEKRNEEARIARALEEHLRQREQQSRLAGNEQHTAKQHTERDVAPVPPRIAKPEAPKTRAEAEAAKAEPAQSEPQESDSVKSSSVASVPLPSRSSAAEQISVAIVVPSRNALRLARLQQKTSPPPLPSRAREKLRDAPLPARALKMPLDAPLPERYSSRATVAESRSAGKKADVLAPVRRPERHRRVAKNHHRSCNDSAAGRAIRTPGTYIVAYGDTLWSIAERHYGAGHLYRRIQRANRRKITRASRIYPCQRIWLPGVTRHRR
jgi:nucleoid-associated protein YgaU